MLGGDEFVLQLGRLLGRFVQNALQFRTHACGAAPRNRWQTITFGMDQIGQPPHVDAHFVQHRSHDAIGLRQHRIKQMHRRNFGVAAGGRRGLRFLDE